MCAPGTPLPLFVTLPLMLPVDGPSQLKLYLHDGELLGNAVRLGRNVLDDLDAELLGRVFRTGSHVLEKGIGQILGEDRDGFVLRLS